MSGTKQKLSPSFHFQILVLIWCLCAVNGPKGAREIALEWFVQIRGSPCAGQFRAALYFAALRGRTTRPEGCVGFVGCFTSVNPAQILKRVFYRSITNSQLLNHSLLGTLKACSITSMKGWKTCHL